MTSDRESLVPGSVAEVESATPYAQPAAPPRPWGHRVRSFVLLVGIWFYFLVAVTVAESYRPDYWAEQSQLVAAGLMVSCSAFFLIGLTLRGMRRTPIYRAVSFFVLAIYLGGAVLMVIYRGKQTHKLLDDILPILVEADARFDSMRNYLRADAVGRIVGEAVLVLSGLLVVLPDLGILNDWE
eukprot:TRINITY_DN1528_c0_g1_i7.p1 TRINITY_DN1528_c0_g1~~TRINITY_DN1528_c0_g1_i7.p1  ORF type:complete len:183 (+),score=41.23 TRINITY_DN1528_c0_g1_i7:121-669(+)